VYMNDYDLEFKLYGIYVYYRSRDREGSVFAIAALSLNLRSLPREVPEMCRPDP
jgi:hypothetical protein